MRVQFWGVRGSYPAPAGTETIREKINAIVQELTPDDLQDQDSRARFLGRLPEWMYGTPGGNTACLEVRLGDGTCLILDAGSGVVALGRAIQNEAHPPETFHFFFTHFHYDHIQGLPFFGPAYNPANQLHFYSPLPDVEFILKDHMQHPYFPITMEDKMSPNQYFHYLSGRSPIRIGSAHISWIPLRHPGGAFAYKIVEANKVFIYATDVELTEASFEHGSDFLNFFVNADVLVLDTMYTLGEAIDKYNWGHSSFSLGVEFAAHCRIKDFYLFHHEPNYSDRQLYNNLLAARSYAQRQEFLVSVNLAQEGTTFHLGD